MNRKTYLITGAGSGIGQSTAMAMAKRGNQIVLLGRDKARLMKTLGLLDGQGHLAIQADQRDKLAVRQALAQVSKLDGLIANAGVGGENKPGQNDRWDEILSINLTGTYHVLTESLPLLRKSDGTRHILIISSILARLGVPGYSAYCASKAGLLGLMRSMSSELASEGILVNAICPGWVDTQMARDGIQAFATQSGMTYEAAHAQQMSYVPLKKMSRPEEIADLLLYLTGENQTSITGQTFDINNGALMPC